MTEKTNYTFAVRNKYFTTANLLQGEQGTLLDIGSRDHVLAKHLKNPSLQYLSADTDPGHDYQVNLESALPFNDKEFDHVVALDVLEHVNNIHDAFSEVLRISRRSVIIALPNLGSIRHRLSFLLCGKLATDKYDLLPERPLDRHHWLTIHSQMNHFVAVNAHRSQFDLRAVIASAEVGWHHIYQPVSALFLSLGLHLGGLFSSRSIYHLVRNGE